ncbi:TraB/GumN family protein [Paenibacillus sp. FSL P4-0184]|uniref:TraB/GumN family protein n=1 Tax=Paenibacillus sp. FSL P4-0184 TaxID=2921632 RepID=UPI0030F81C03
MKKLGALFLSIFMVMSVFTTAHAAEKPVGVWIDGTEVKLGNSNPVVEKGTTLVPMRPLLEKLNVNMNWNKKTQTVTGTKNGLALSLTIGSTTATVNGEKKKLEVAPKTINNVTYVPVRFIGETIGYKVEWNAAQRTITFVANNEAAGSTGFLWKVENNGNTVYLLGSIHVANDKMYPLRPEIEAAFEASQYLGVEVDLTKVDQTEMQKFLTEKGSYTDGTKLKDHVSADTYNKVVALLKANGLAGNAFDSYKPWVVTQGISSLQMQTTDYTPDTGIDLYFTQKAGKLNKPIIELENMQLQLNMFNQFSDGLQEKLLLDTLDSLKQTDKAAATASLDGLSQMWMQGDEQTLVAMTQAVAKEPEYYKGLVSDRNANMVKHVKEYLNSDKKATYLVVVGALHMLGDDGIVTQLQKDGFNVVKQ